MTMRVVLASFVALVGCHRPVDVGPIRAELADDVRIVCAPPRARPPHAPAAATSPTVAELEDAATKLCVLGQDLRACSSVRPLDDACRSMLAEAAAPLDVIAAGLREDRAVVGAARHSRTLYGPSVDLGAIAQGDKAAIEHGKSVIETQRNSCHPDTPEVDELMLASARDLAERGRADEALERCANHVAMQRDLAIDATMIDAMVVTNRLQQARRICEPFVAAATPAAAKRFADALAGIRASIPPITMVLPRDRAEVMLSTFGPIRAPDLDLACDRARKLATRGGPPTNAPKALETARKNWDEIAKAGTPSVDKYGEEYEKGLLALGMLTAAAAQRH